MKGEEIEDENFNMEQKKLSSGPLDEELQIVVDYYLSLTDGFARRRDIVWHNTHRLDFFDCRRRRHCCGFLR